MQQPERWCGFFVAKPAAHSQPLENPGQFLDSADSTSISSRTCKGPSASFPVSADAGRAIGCLKVRITRCLAGVLPSCPDFSGVSVRMRKKLTVLGKSALGAYRKLRFSHEPWRFPGQRGELHTLQCAMNAGKSVILSLISVSLPSSSSTLQPAASPAAEFR